MNANCYKIIFSKRLGTLVAVGEHTSSAGKPASGQACRGVAPTASMADAMMDGFVGVLRLAFAAVTLACMTLSATQAQSNLAPLAANALPQGGSINAGAATISTQGATMAITQATDKASINWQSFNVGTGASVNITQPSASSVLLNRVVGNDPSQILGKLSANGQLILLNPNGIVFGKDGSVAASTFTASTFGLSDADFMDGFHKYSRNGSTAAVVNQGTIETSAGGFVALIGATVTNEGTIRAPQGDVMLVAAENVTLPGSTNNNTVSVRMSKRVRLELDPAAINTAVNNTESGVIVTEGGQVLLQAAALSTAVASVTHSGSIDTSAPQAGAVTVLAEGGIIKVDGSITANSSGSDGQGQQRKGGDIIIGRDEETGALAKFTDVSGAKLESQHGFVETSGDVLATTGTRVKADEWLLDPYNITIAASGATGTTYASSFTSDADSTILASDISANLTAGTSVTIATGAGGASAGDINVNASIAKTGGADATLTLKAHNDIVVAANTTITSTVGKLNVTLNSDSDTSGSGAIVMGAGSGITSIGGNILLGGSSTGTSWTRGNATHPTAIELTGTTLNAGGGNITMYGYTDSFAAVANGVGLTGSSISTTGAGTINISGYSYGLNGLSSGVVLKGSTVTGGSTGTTTISGINSSSGTSNRSQGVWLDASGGVSSLVTSTGGSVTVTGRGGGGGSSAYNYGVAITDGLITSGGTGAVTVTGTGGNGTGADNAGVAFNGPNQANGIASAGGAVTVTGTAGSGASSQGIWFVSGYQGSITSGANAAITLTTDSLVMDQGVINAGSGTVTIQNRTSTTTVNVGGTGTDTLTGTLGLDVSSAELAKITAGKIVVGRNDATGSGAVTVSALNMGAMGNTGADLSVLSKTNIAVNDSITKTAGTDATLSLLANSNITVATNKTITASTGKLNVLLNSDSDATSGGAIVFNTGSGITSNGGNITLGGGSALDGSGFAVADGVNSLQGVSLNTAAINAGGGNVVMNGKTAATNYQTSLSNISGIYMAGGSISTTGSGTINLTGNNQNTDTQSQGFVLSSGTITGGSTGAVTITGDSRAVTSSTYTYVRGALVNGTVTSTGGNIGITGYGGAGVQYDYGVDVSGSVTTTGAGAVSITGTAGAGASGGNVGVTTSGTGNISSVDGAITITGTGGIGNGAQIRDHGVQIGGSNAVRSTGTGDITATGTVTNNDNGFSLGVAISTGGLRTNSGNIKVDGTALLNYQVAAYINAPITSTSGNVYIRSASANIQNTTAGTISGNNVSIDNTGGTIDANGVITKGAGGASSWAGVISQNGIDLNGAVTAANNLNVYGNQTGFSSGVSISGATTTISAKNLTINGNSNTGTGINIASSITASGNVSLLGNVTTVTKTGVNLTSAASVTSSAAAATINISANGNVVNAAAIKDTGTTGTGSNINITSTSGNISGTGSIGDTTNKNSDVTFTQAGTSTYSGAINAANFSKAGAGTLTLDSWIQATPVFTNISNAYTVKSGGLTLSPGATYAWLNPANVNVENASVFSLNSSSNSRWHNTAFNFTGGSGGGTMNLLGNPIGTSGTTNTFSTSGGATNAIVGVLNANDANVNFNLSAATSGTTLADGSFAALAFTQNTVGGYGLGSGGNGAGTVNVAGGGNLLFKDKAKATNFNINAGTVQFGDGSAAATGTTANFEASNVAIASGAKLVFNRAEAYSNASVITGSGNLIQAGVGTLTLTGNSSAFAGATTVNAGKSLAIGTGGSLGAAGSTLTLTDSAANFSFTNTSGTSTVASTISGAGTVTENGTGGIGLLLGNNTYTGTTTITAGTLQVGNGGAVGSLGTGAVVDNSALVFNRSDNVTVSNLISGTGALTQAGLGTILLTNNNTYTGQTYVNAGTLSLGTTATTGTANPQYFSSQFNIAAGATLDFNAPTGVTLDNRGATFTGGGTITKTGAGSLRWNVVGDTNFNMLAGSLIDVKEGTFTGSTSYHGKWINNLSGLNVASGAAFKGDEGEIRVDALTGAGSVSSGWTTLGSLTVGVNNTAAGAYNTTAGTATFSGVLSGPAPLNKIGTGTQILTGTNTYTGATNITAGVLQVGDGGTTGTLGTGAVANSTSLVFNRSDAALVVGATISGAGTITQSGTGTTTLSANNTYSGATTVSAGNLQVGNGSNTGTLGTSAVSVSVGTNLTFYRNDASLSIANNISGAGSVNLKGTGVASQSSYALTGNNSSFTGGINVSLARLAISAANQIGTASVTVNSGSSLWTNGGFTINNALSLAGNGWSENTYGQLGALRLQNGTTYAGSITLAADARIGAYGSTGTVSGQISGAKNLESNSGSNGTVILTGANTYTGTTTIGAGTLQVGNGGTIGTLGTNTGAITNNGTLTIKHSDTFSIANVISGTGALNQAGAGTTTLTGDNNYSGATTITAGTLQIGNGGSTGSLGNTTGVTLSNNANLAFNKSNTTTIDKAISGNGNVSADISGGDLALTSAISLTGSNTINLTASGSITETAGSLAATNLYMTATGGSIGTSGQRIQSNVNSLSLSSAGDQFVTETNGVTVASRTTNNGSINLLTTNGTLSVGVVNSITGISAHGTGNITLSGTSTSGIGLYVGNNVSSTSGDVSITGTSSATSDFANPEAAVKSAATISGKDITMVATVTSTTGKVLGYYGALGGFSASGQLNLTGTTSNGSEGFYSFDGSLSSVTGMRITGTSASGNAVGFDKTMRLTNGSGGITITGTATNGTQQAISLRGLAITNSGGDVQLNAINGSIFSDAGDPAWTGQTNTITNSGTGAVRVSAGNASATNSGAINGSVLAIHQNGNGGVVVNTSGTGNLTAPKVVNAGTGDIVVAAGSAIAAGTGSGGQVLTIAGNTLTQTNATPGKTYVYSGEASSTGVLSNLSTGFNSLYYAGTSQALNTKFSTAFDGTPTDDLSAPAGGSVSNTQVFFRSATKPGFSMTLANSAKAYGNTDPTTFSATNGATLTNVYAGAGGNNTFAVTTADVVAGLTGTRTAGENVGSYAYTLDASSFNTTLTAQPNLVIGKRDVTLTGITAANKAYDGTTAANITSGVIATGVGSETLLVSGAGTFSDKNAADNKTVTVADVTQLTKANGSGNWSNYNLTTTGALNTVANIDKAALSVTATTVTKTYDGGLSATGTGTVGTIAGAGDSVSYAGSQAFLDANAGSNKTVRASGVTLKDAANADMTGNYTITYTDNVTSVINKAALTVTANADARFVTQADVTGYNGVSYSGFQGADTSAVVNASGLSITRTNALTDVSAGTYTGVLVPTGVAASNYDISYTNGNYTVVPAAQLLVRTTNQNVTYGTTPTYSTTAQYLDANSNQITTLTQSGTNNNYTFTDGAGTTVSFALKPYSGANTAAQSTSGNTVVGTHDVKDMAYTQAGNNFTGTPVFVGVVTVDKKAITPTASGVTKVYDGTTFMNNVVVGMTGKLTNDVVAISGSGAFTQKNVGSNLGYSVTGINLASGDASNYYLNGGLNSFSGNDGIITAAPLVITSGNVTKTYDRTTTAAGVAQAATGSQTFGNDSLSGGTFAFTSAAAGAGNKTVTVSGVTVNDGNNGNNYAVSYADNTTSTITPKALAATVSATSKTYDGTTNATVTASTNDVISGDTVVVSGGNARFDTKHVGTGKTVTATGLSLSGTEASNYTLGNTSATTTADINQAALTVTASQVSKEYDGLTTATGTGTLGALAGAGAGEVVNNAGVQVFTNKDAGAGNKTVQARGVTLKDAIGQDVTANYAISYADNLTSTITPAPLTIQVNDTAMFVTQDARTATNQGFSYSGFKNGETQATALVGGALVGADRSYNGTSPFPTAGSYSGVYGLATTPTSVNGNYIITVRNGNLTVVPADKLLITLASQSDTYGNRTATNAGQVANGTVTAQYCLTASDCTGANLVNLTMTQLTGSHWKAADNTGSYVVFDTTALNAAYSTGGFMKAGNYTLGSTEVVPLSLPNGNFTGRATNGGVLTINPLAATLSANPVSKTYDGNTSITGVTVVLTNQVTGDVVNAAASTGSFASKEVGTGIAVALSNLGLSGADAANYYLTTNALSTTGSIMAANNSGAGTNASSGAVSPPKPIIPDDNNSSSEDGKGSGGSASAQNPYWVLPNGTPDTADSCTASNLEACTCEKQEAGGLSDVSICYQPKKTASAQASRPRS